MKWKPFLSLAALALLATACAKPPSWDEAWRLEKEGQFAPAAKAYHDYLVKHPETSLKDQALLRMAHCEEGLGNYPKALEQYQAVLTGNLGGEAEIKAYLGAGNLYRDHLNDQAKALDAYERALSLYLNQSDIRDAIKMLVDAKLQTADALFTKKEFQDSARMARAILQSYPDTYLASDSKAKAQGLVDRVDRSGRIQSADADQVFVVKETEDSPQAVSDFAASQPVTGVELSPDGKSRALVRKQNGVPFLYLGTGPSGKATYHLVSGSTGACRPQWSPRGDALAFVRILGTTQKLDRVESPTGKTLNLFFAKNGSLGRYPAFDPSGSKIAYVYAHCLWVMNADGTNKTKLKTEKPVDPSSVIAWSVDGTLVKYRVSVDKGTGPDKLLVLDAGSQRP